MCKVCNNSYPNCPACEIETKDCPDCWGDGVFLTDDDDNKVRYKDNHSDIYAKRICKTCRGSGAVACDY